MSSSNGFTAVISASDIATAGTATVTVANPDGQISNAICFSITPPPNQGLSLTGLDPGTADAGGPGFKQPVFGTGFTNSSVVRWNGQNRQTTFVNSTQLLATISASDVQAAGTASVTVFNPGSNITSNVVCFTILPAPGPSLQAALPDEPEPFTSVETGFIASDVQAVSYTVTPSATTPGGQGIGFDPTSRTYSPLTGDVTNANFTALTPTYAVSGVVTRVDGAPVRDVEMKIALDGTPLPQPDPILTEPDGSYIIGNLRVRGNYAITPTHSTYRFDPVIVEINGIDQNFTDKNFTARACSPPVISAQPNNQTACIGSSVSFSVAANGAPPLSYQWRKDGAPIPGATASIYAITSATANDAGAYSVTVTDSCGSSVTSTVASLTVSAAASISSQPVSQSACTGASVAFSVAASGENLTYQWRRNSAPIPGATGNRHTIASVTANDAGSYDVVVTGACGPVTSQPATLVVNAFSLDATSGSFPPAGGNGVINVSATVNICPWTATKSAAWITLGSSGGTGSGVLIYNVAPNASTNSRDTTLTVAGISFRVTQAGAVPAATLSNLSPVSALVGSAGFTLTVNGADFTAASKVRWQGSERTTNLISATQLAAEIIAADLATSGSFNVDVVNPPPSSPSNTLPFTVIQPYEADVTPRPPGGNGLVTVTDWTLIGRYAAGLEAPAIGGEFQRADCAPRFASDGVTLMLGDDRLTVTDWVQAGRYAAGIDPLTLPGGPTASFSSSPLRTETLNPPSAAGSRTLRLITNYAARGATRSVVIELDAQGNENALGFSLLFDPAQWRLLSATPGRNAAASGFIVNDAQAASGRLGVVLALPAGQALKAGRRQIAMITFASLSRDADNPGVIVFSDGPVAREVVDVRANRLPIVYSGGGTERTLRLRSKQ